MEPLVHTENDITVHVVYYSEEIALAVYSSTVTIYGKGCP